jgi:hypothetical protein
MNEFERRLRFIDAYVAAGLAAWMSHDTWDDAQVELEVARLLREVDQYWRVYREYEERQK